MQFSGRDSLTPYRPWACRKMQVRSYMHHIFPLWLPFHLFFFLIPNRHPFLGNWCLAFSSQRFPPWTISLLLLASCSIPKVHSADISVVTESATVMAATGGAPSPSDRIQILSQPRRASSTARSVHSAQEMANTPVSQPTHWQTQHAYASNMPSPHVEHPQTSWNGLPQSHQANPTVSISIPNPSLHSGEPVSYPNSYGMENNARAMSYPLENSSLVTSQSMQMGGYNTPPTSNPSPHPDSYQRHMSVPMNAPPPAPHGPHQHPHSYSSQGHQGYVPQSSHPGDLQMMAHSPHPQSHIGRVGSIAVPYGVEYDG
jgi:hypothetical protein